MKNSATKLLLLTGSLVLVLWFILWIISFGFVDIKPSNLSGGGKTYTIIDKTGNQIANAKTSSNHFHKLLKKGTYQIRVTSGEENFIQIVKVGGLFHTTNVTTALRPEKSRQFVGDNPNFCMFYGQEILFSYNCGEPGGLTAHLPATIDTPTATITEREEPFIPLVGLLNINGVNKALVADDEGAGVGLYDIDSGLRLTNPIELSGIGSNDATGITPYKSGFIVYSKNLRGVKYFLSPGSTPSDISTPKPAFETSNPAGLSMAGEDIGALFNSNSGGEDPSGATKGKSEFIYYGAGVNRSYTFDKLYTSGGLCGKDRLCLVGSGVLDVYDVSRKKPTYVFSMKDVQQVFYANNGMTIATGSNIVSLDPQSLTGSVQLSYGGSQYCGINASGNGYAVCLINNKGDKAALLVDPSSNNTDSIDKKVLGMLKDPNIDKVSVYKNNIYVSPNLGQLVYVPAINGYDYDPAVKQAAHDDINKLVQRLGINTSRYTVTGPF